MFYAPLYDESQFIDRLGCEDEAPTGDANPFEELPACDGTPCAPGNVCASPFLAGGWDAIDVCAENGILF